MSLVFLIEKFLGKEPGSLTVLLFVLCRDNGGDKYRVEVCRTDKSPISLRSEAHLSLSLLIFVSISLWSQTQTPACAFSTWTSPLLHASEYSTQLRLYVLSSEATLCENGLLLELRSIYTTETPPFRGFPQEKWAGIRSYSWWDFGPRPTRDLN